MKCLSPANFNMTATREGQPLWTEAGWARRMLGTALARGWIRAGGDTPRPPLGFICSHGQAPSPAAHHCSASPTVLPLCRAASSRASATSARTSRSHGCVAGTKLPFLFHLHISAVEEGSDLGTHCRAAEPSSHNTNLNPSLAWRQSCAQLSLSWRERPQRILLQLQTGKNALEKSRNPRSVPCSPLPFLPGFQVPQNNHITMSFMQHQQCWTVLRCHVHRSSASII